MDTPKSQIVIYKDQKGNVKIDVRFDDNTVWLTQNALADLLQTTKQNIGQHIKNVIAEGELSADSTVKKFFTVQKEGGRIIKRNVDLYNLDVIISVGYRVKSLQGTKFRIWATKTLKDYLVKGYAINEKRLLEAQNKFKELQSAIDFLQKKSGHELMAGQEQEILSLLGDYSKTLSLLEQYDTEKLSLSKKGRGSFVMTYDLAKSIISSIGKELKNKKEASEFFGKENGDKLNGIMGALYQTFDKKELYPSLEEKAAHLLYFIIKDHPFVDGNKRTASFLFAYFLDKNNYLYKETGEKKINDNGLAALALLIAVSDRSEKEKLIKIITNLLIF
jgi:death-on-curing family protein